MPLPQKDVIVKSSAPVLVGQILVSQGWLSGAVTGDPALSIVPALEQLRNAYVIPTPQGWTSSFVVIATPVGNAVTIDGASTDICTINPVGSVSGVAYESRRCAVGEGVHRLAAEKPFGVTAYGYGTAGSYAFVAGADARPIYSVPAMQ